MNKALSMILLLKHSGRCLSIQFPPCVAAMLHTVQLYKVCCARQGVGEVASTHIHCAVCDDWPGCQGQLQGGCPQVVEDGGVRPGFRAWSK